VEMSKAANVPFQIVRTHHAELRVRDLEAARTFYVDLLGFVETERTADALYLRGLEEAYHHSLVLRLSDRAACDHIAFKVATPADVEAARAHFEARGFPVRVLGSGEELGQGGSVRVQDPMGFPMEFFYEMDNAESHLRRFDRYRGAFPMRLDHVNIFVADAQAAHEYYTDGLGFRCSEYTETDREPRRIWGSWLHRKDSVHDIATTNGDGPRLHHLGFWVQDTASVLRACDILAAAGFGDSIERGPGRHGISNAFFLYLRDPDRHRIELYTGDYLTADPDLAPLRWSVADPKRGTFWGHKAPASWFEEGTPVVSILSGENMPVRSPVLGDRPDFAT